MSISNLGSIVDQMRGARQKSHDISERLAAGGTKIFYSGKTTSQIDVSITETNRIKRLEGFQQGNALVGDRLKAQLFAIDKYLGLAEKIRSEFAPGSYTMGGTRPGLDAIKESIKSSFHDIGIISNAISGEYAMGGVATQNPPMKNATTFAAYSGSPVDYSAPVSGSITVYINDEGDTVSLSGNDFDAEVQALFEAIMKLDSSATGADEASEQASALATAAQKALLTKYHDKLADIQRVEDQDDELLTNIQEAMEIKAKYTEDNIEGLLAELMASGVMEQIAQHIFTSLIQKSQNAVRMLEK